MRPDTLELPSSPSDAASGIAGGRFDRTNLYEQLYANRSYHNNPSTTHALPIIAALLAPKFAGRAPYTRVLDVGCSHGAGVQRLWELGFQASGMDLAPTAVIDEELESQALKMLGRVS